MYGWYYMKPGLLGETETGPLDDSTMLQMAYEGRLKLRTMMRHPLHTENQWCYLENVPLAKKKLDEGIVVRARQADEALAAGTAAKELAKYERAEAKEAARREKEVAIERDRIESMQRQIAAQEQQRQFPVTMTPQFRCPYCSSNLPPLQRYETTTAGWIFCVVLFLLLCWPLCWIGYFFKEHHIYCSHCGIRFN